MAAGANSGVNARGQGNGMCHRAVPPGVASLETRSAHRNARLRSTVGNRGARGQEKAPMFGLVPLGVASLLGELASASSIDYW